MKGRYGIPSISHPVGITYRLMLLCLMLLFLCVLPAAGQDIDDTDSEPAPASPDTTSEESTVTTSQDDIIGPPLPIDFGEIIATIIAPEAPPVPPMQIFEDSSQQVPVIQIRGEYFDPSGLCATGPMSAETNSSIRSRMQKTAEMGFRSFMLRVDWQSIEPEANHVEASRVQELLAYANDLRLKVIISLELSHAPAWFFSGEDRNKRVMVSRLVDPEMETASGNDGDLRWTNGTGIPILYHPDTILAMKNLIYSLYYTIKDEPAILAWYVNGPVTFAFPGGGRDGVVGLCDFSPFTVNRFYEATGTPFMAYPLTRYSQGTWDQRSDFRIFTNLRVIWKREAFDEIIGALGEIDPKHLILVGMEPALNYANDNGYLSMIQAPDATRQMHHRAVDGVVISFRLSSDTFERTGVRSECSAMHLALTINQVIRNGKLAIVLVEPDNDNPPVPVDITHVADMIKAAGGYPLWCSSFVNKRGRRWSWIQEVAIERTQPLSLLPPPKRIRRGQVGIFDLPQFYSSFYAEQNASLSISLTQLAIHRRTGVVLEIVNANEIVDPGPILQQYTNIIYLVPALLTSESAKTWLDPLMQVELAGYSLGSDGIIEAVDPILLHQYAVENYHSPNLEDQLRTRYVHRGATADLLHGADAFVVANDPYVFIRVNRLWGARYIDVKLNGWPESSLAAIDVVELNSGDPLNVEMISGSASFPFSPVRNAGHLYVLTDDFAPVARLYEGRKTAVAIIQQSRQMRRSVPAALLLAALLAVTLVWMTFQSQQKSLLQAAELVDRRRQIEPIDMLDEPEVMEFYKTYISDPDNDKKNPLN